MIPLDEARRHVVERCPKLAEVDIAIGDALGGVLAVDVVSSQAVPPFDNTAMDGFALRAADSVGAPQRLRIVGTIAAGDAPSFEVRPGQAARIMTGAVIPAGADAIVMVERTTVDGDDVVVEISVEPGNHIRPAGDDIEAGDVVFEAGSLIEPGHIGVLASIGSTQVAIYPRPRVGVLSTGDELVEGGGALEPGQIHESNGRMLLAMLQQIGVEPVDLGLAHDDKASIEAAIRRGVDSCDAVVTSGGVSMGDYDYVKAVLDDIGDMRWMQIAIKPAKPFAFGLVDGVPVFGLPGNPVSSMVSFELLARPGLRAMQHRGDVEPAEVLAVADENLSRHPDGKTHFLRVVARPGPDGRYHVQSSGGQGSHMLWAMARANGLAVVPDGDGIEAGGEVGLILL